MNFLVHVLLRRFSQFLTLENPSTTLALFKDQLFIWNVSWVSERISLGIDSPVFSTPPPQVSAESAFKKLLKQSLLLSVIVPFAFLTLMGWRFYRLSLASKEMLTSEHLLTQITAFHTSFLEMQSSVRGFLLTRNENFLKYYYTTLPTIEPALAKLLILTEHDREQRNTLFELKRALDQWITVAEGFVVFGKKPTSTGTT